MAIIRLVNWRKSGNPQAEPCIRCGKEPRMKNQRYGKECRRKIDQEIKVKKLLDNSIKFI